MTQPVHVPNESPEVKVMGEAQRGGLKYRLLIDADYGPTTGIAQGIFYLYDSHTESRHRHQLAETVHVLDGSGKVTIEDREIALSVGDTVFIPAGHRHGFEAEGTLTMLFTFACDSFSDVEYDYGDAA
ncbi:cupin domain-containing protein [Roseivivax marinus]|uniref:cupin domain-containing protein n=1 Tax=Roseivivax marinus TaxID=1379903 RepID=UPI001F046B14|nr:cupin domain-containing protein [Roseivivax marinus]UMA65088.1 cupin domain-containing protein [Roseivivax marinus]